MILARGRDRRSLANACSEITSRDRHCPTTRFGIRSFSIASIRRRADKKDDDSTGSWQSVVDKVSDFSQSTWKDIKLPKNALKVHRFLSDMKSTFDFEPDSMGAQVLHEAKEDKFAEVDAVVRIGSSLCEEELEFVRKRSKFTKRALAKYIGVEEDTIHEEDVPTIGIAASGGGLRACIATASYLKSMKDSSLLDCVTYSAAVSGSTWAQTLFYSSLGKQDPDTILTHLKTRLQTHIAEPLPNLDMLMDPIKAKYILRGVLENWDRRDFSLVDVYGFLLSSRFFVSDKKVAPDDEDLKISSQARFLRQGENPMPIYSVVRQEQPTAVQKSEHEETNAGQESKPDVTKSYFQFFEFSPYEFGSEEVAAWIPTWAVGRRFENGTSTERHPEMKLTSLLGTFSSAFCASVSHYWQEVKLFLPKDIPLLKTMTERIAARDEEMKDIHLVEANRVPNYAKGLSNKLPSSVPESLSVENDDLDLCDAGMANNLPFYPLLRRDCDIIIALDSSAELETTPWFERTEGYVQQRNIKGWPVGAGWPKSGSQNQSELEAATTQSKAAASDKLDEAKKHLYALDGVNIWIGQSTKGENSPESDGSLKATKVSDSNMDIVSGSAGLMLIYLPLLPHEKVPEADPTKTDFLSTWNFIYSPENVDDLGKLTQTHFDEGSEKIKLAVKAMYERKKQERLRTAS